MNLNDRIATDAGFVGLDRIRMTYGPVVALDDVTLDIREGEFVTLLGPSGSGKTTCLRAIAGMLTPDSGRLTISGRDVSRVPMHRRNIGMVFQNYSLFPHMNVAENVAYPLRVRRVRGAEAEARVRRALELVRLGDFAHRRTTELSGGQQQRVALARAIVFEPDVLLLDEPLSALDRVLREEMQLELRRIHREIGTTMICVTHDRAEALVMSDRVVVMRDGAIVQDATPEAIYLQPKTRFVAEFLGEINRLPMTVSGPRRLADARGREIAVETDLADPSGSPVELAARVEQVAVRALSSPGDPADWCGTIREALFLGDGVRLVIDCEPHEIIARLTLDRAIGLRAGMPVALDFAPGSVLVFPGTEG